MNAYYGYTGAKVCCVVRLLVNELSFGVGFDSECSVCLWRMQAGFKVFHFNRLTVNSNNLSKKKPV